MATLTGLGEATRGDKERSVEFSWKLYDKESEYSRDANNAIYAVLSVRHHKRSWNTTEDYFSVSLNNVERADILDGDGNKIGRSEKFGLFQGVGIARYDAGTRFSRKKLDEAADRALAEFVALYECGNEKVLSYFEGRG